MSDALKTSNITRMQLYKKNHGGMVGALIIGHDKTLEKTAELLGLASQHDVSTIYVVGATADIETFLKDSVSRFRFHFAADYDSALDLIFADQ
ncbi:MAG: hypothetical protein ACN6OV_06700 [Acinetobacter sp.]|uniref:hypothetical protein n=1 Tax=Acinetobacter sp. TaxID=472 RepID=UPI003D06657D